jgi:hypothetical protein
MQRQHCELQYCISCLYHILSRSALAAVLHGRTFILPVVCTLSAPFLSHLTPPPLLPLPPRMKGSRRTRRSHLYPRCSSCLSTYASCSTGASSRVGCLLSAVLTDTHLHLRTAALGACCTTLLIPLRDPVPWTENSHPHLRYCTTFSISFLMSHTMLLIH